MKINPSYSVSCPGESAGFVLEGSVVPVEVDSNHVRKD